MQPILFRLTRFQIYSDAFICINPHYPLQLVALPSLKKKVALQKKNKIWCIYITMERKHVMIKKLVTLDQMSY